MRKVRRYWLWTLAAALAGLAIAQGPYLFRRFWTYPRAEQALAALESQRAVEPRADGLTDFRGVFHAHSYLSHDSMGTPQEMIRGAQRAGIDFIFMTDHYRSPTDRLAIEQGLRGEHGGVVFVPGVETSGGLIAWFLDRADLDVKKPMAEQLAAIRQAGGLAFFCHPDEERPWELDGFAGMEIYNLHADAKKSRLTLYWRMSENFWSMPRYPMRVYHTLFYEPAEYLAIWDRLTERRRVVAVAGNDAHQNNGVRLVVTRAGTLVLTDTSPSGKPWTEYRNWYARRVARRHAPGDTVWRWDADLYERSYHFVNTHLLARRKRAEDLRAALEAGHAYVAFDSLVTATGFDFAYTAPGGRAGAVMGDELPFRSGGLLEAKAPVESVLRLLRNGRQVFEQQGRSLRYAVPQPGVYRVEAHLKVRGKLMPWIYSNPIYLR